jgi:hypothetical protein
MVGVAVQPKASLAFATACTTTLASHYTHIGKGRDASHGRWMGAGIG